MNVYKIIRNWFKVSVSIFHKEDKEYCKPCSSYVNKNIFSWQKFACKFYTLADNWLIAREKELLDSLLKIKSNIE